MKDVFFERQNKGLPQSPYVDFNRDVIFNYPPHYHEELEAVYIQSGSMTVTVGNRETLLNTGDIFTVSPSVIHSFRSDMVCNNCIMKLYTPSELFKYELTLHITPLDMGYKKLHTLVEQIIIEANGSLPCRDIALSALAESFMIALVREFGAAPIDDAAALKNHHSIEVSAKIAAYFEDHYHESITLEKLADACGYSRFYFSRNFKDFTSLGFSDFAASFRIEKAKRMLSEGRSILDSAFACGFNSPRTFNRSFKKFAGMTPSEYIAVQRKREQK